LTRKNAPDVFNVKWPARSSRQAFSIQHNRGSKSLPSKKKVERFHIPALNVMKLGVCRPVQLIQSNSTRPQAQKLSKMTLALVVKCARLLVHSGTINYVVDTGKVAKCDLCGGDPACAKACPTDAITFVDSGWTGLDKMRKWAAKANEASL
jgi:ferredoxin